MSTVTIAPHLWKALEVMGRDMAVEPAALVNQALFAWLRINGYVIPGQIAAVAAPEVVSVAAAAPVAPIAASALESTPPPMATAPEAAPVASAAASAPEPVAAPAHTPLELVLQRMEEIDADLSRLTRPRPAWAMPEEEEEEEEEEQADSEEAPEEDQEAPEEDEEQEESEEREEPEEEAPHADEPSEGSTVVGLARPRPEEDAPGEGTFVLRAAPIVLIIEREGQLVRVEKDPFIIGRGPQCDMVIESPRVSREHVSLRRRGVTFVLEDLGSSNGTWLGEERITTRELEDGDTILLGNEAVRFTLEPGG